MDHELEFYIYLSQARIEVLKERESRIVELRYGLAGEEPLTLEAIGKVFEISRERVRQLLHRSLQKIVTGAKKKVNSSCADLVKLVRTAIRPEEENSVERLIQYCRTNLSSLPLRTHGIPLVGYLVYSDTRNRQENISIALNACKTIEDNKRRYHDTTTRFEDLLRFVIYPAKPRYLTEDDCRLFTRQRDVSSDGEGKSGSFFSDKLGRSVQYESGLELKFLKMLEMIEEVRFYQEQPIRLAYVYDSQTRNYYPDILFVMTDGKGIVVEIVPVFMMALSQNLAKWSALKAFCLENGLGLLVTDGTQAIQQIQKHEIESQFVSYMLERLEKGGLSWTDYKQIKDQFNPSRDDFVALILQYRLIWRLDPFCLGFASK